MSWGGRVGPFRGLNQLETMLFDGLLQQQPLIPGPVPLKLDGSRGFLFWAPSSQIKEAMEAGWWPVRLWPSQNPEAALSDTKSSPQLAPPKCAEKKSFLSRDDGLCRGVRKQRGLERRHTPKPPTNALKDMAEKGGWFWHRGGQGGLPGHRTLELGTKGEEEISAMDKAVCKVSGRRWGLRSECSQCISQTVKRCTRLLVTQKPAAHRDGGAWAAGGVRSLCLDSSKGYLTASRN